MVLSVSPSDVVVFSPDPESVVSREGNTTVIWLAGEHDLATAEALSGTLAQAMAKDHTDLVVDLSGVTFLSAGTLGILIRGRNFLDAQSRHLALRAPSLSSQRLVDVCGMSDLIESR